MSSNIINNLNPQIIGQRLQELRKGRGLNQQQVADILKVARTTVVAVEKGQRLLQPEEIMRLCDTWAISVSDFVRPREVIEQFIPQLRTAAKRGDVETDDSAGIDEATDLLRRLCENYLELEVLCSAPLRRKYPPVYEVSGIPLSQAAEDAANQERNRLGLGDGPISNLRQLLEGDVGLRIFYIPLPSRVAGMFVFDEKLGGCIAINIKHPEERRRWSLVHEYWHFLKDRYIADICVLPFRRRINEHEKQAELFTQHFLMPTNGLRRRFYELRTSHNGQITPADLLTLAGFYGVSFEALLLRLEGLSLIMSGTWEHLKSSGFKVREAQAALQLSRPNEQESSLPIRYQYLAVEAFQSEKLSQGQLSHILGVSPVEAREIVHELSQELSLSDEGAVGQLKLDFSEPLNAA